MGGVARAPGGGGRRAWGWRWRGEAGVGEDLGAGEAGDGGLVAGGEFDEAEHGAFGVVLGGDLELLGDESGAELAVGLVFLGGEEGVGFVLGEVEFVEHVVEFGGGVAEGVVEGVEGFGWCGGFVERGGDGVLWHGFPLNKVPRLLEYTGEIARIKKKVCILLGSVFIDFDGRSGQVLT